MIIICGDSLIDFLPAQTEGGGQAAYLPVPGGSCRNIAVGLGRLGAAVGFMGGISNDFFGDQIVSSMQVSGVSMEYVARLDHATTLAFVKLGDGEPEYAFFDEASASRCWTRAASPALGGDVTALHVGSLGLISPPIADECLALMREEKGRRVLCIDPNCRPTLTHDLPVYRARIAEALALADIIKLSRADLEYLIPGADPGRIARDWIAAGTALVVVTKGGEGATAWVKAGSVDVPVGETTVVDTVGAGDSFIAAVLCHLDRIGRLRPDRLGGIELAEAEGALRFAVRVAAFTCGRAGSNPPWSSELQEGGATT